MKIKNNLIKIRAVTVGIITAFLLCSGVVLANTGNNVPSNEKTIKKQAEISKTQEISKSQNKEKSQKIKAEDMYEKVAIAESSYMADLTSNQDWMIAELVVNGKFGNNDNEIKKQLEKEGYDYNKIQKFVKEIKPETKEVNEQETKDNSVSPYTTNDVSNESGSLYTTNNESVYITSNVSNNSKSLYTVSTDTDSDNVSDNSNLKTKKVIKAYPHKNFKSYMSWTALSPKSTQGELLAKATPDPKTAIMMYNGRYLVALGFAYAEKVGEEIDIVMESGQIIHAIVGDFKAKEHTDEYNSSQRWDGSIVEFIVSSNDEAHKITNGTGSYNDIFPGLVKEFRK